MNQRTGMNLLVLGAGAVLLGMACGEPTTSSASRAGVRPHYLSCTQGEPPALAVAEVAGGYDVKAYCPRSGASTTVQCARKPSVAELHGNHLFVKCG